MLLGLSTAALVLTALVWELSRPGLATAFTWTRTRVRKHLQISSRADRARELDYDPGRERRAEQRARALLRSCVNEHEWAMYRDLGFLRVCGHAQERYAYLIYPHKPIVAYVPRTGALLNEYCVAFPDHSRPYGSARLPDSDDVLAKWMALSADERGLIADANMHLPGRQVDPRRVTRDLARLAAWEREHASATGVPEAGVQMPRTGTVEATSAVQTAGPRRPVADHGAPPRRRAERGEPIADSVRAA